MIKTSKNDDPLCPLCIVNGKYTSLKLYQINFAEAVYLCSDKSCQYPQGYDWIFVNRCIDIASDDSESESSVKKESKLSHIDELNFLINKYENETENKKDVDNKTDTWNEITSLLGFAESPDKNPIKEELLNEPDRNSIGQYDIKNVDEIANEILDQLNQPNDNSDILIENSDSFFLDPELLVENSWNDSVKEEPEKTEIDLTKPIVLHNIKISDSILSDKNLPGVKIKIVLGSEEIKIDQNTTDNKETTPKKRQARQTNNVEIRRSNRPRKTTIMKDFIIDKKALKNNKKISDESEKVPEVTDNMKMLSEKQQNTIAILKAMKRGYK